MGALLVTGIFLAPAIVGIYLLGYALCKAAARPNPPVPPTHPRRRVDLDLSDIEWDWRA